MEHIYSSHNFQITSQTQGSIAVSLVIAYKVCEHLSPHGQ